MSNRDVATHIWVRRAIGDSVWIRSHPLNDRLTAEGKDEIRGIQPSLRDGMCLAWVAQATRLCRRATRPTERAGVPFAAGRP